MFSTVLPLGLFLSGASVLVWSVLLGYHLVNRYRERRRVATLMYLTGVIVSVGTFASSFGFAISSGAISFGELNAQLQTIVSFVASIGRGALLMAGILLLATHITERQGL